MAPKDASSRLLNLEELSGSHSALSLALRSPTHEYWQENGYPVEVALADLHTKGRKEESRQKFR